MHLHAPNRIGGVLGHGVVGGEEHGTFDLGLCDEDGVEGIFVERGQARHLLRVGDGNGDGEAVIDIGAYEYQLAPSRRREKSGAVGGLGRPRGALSGAARTKMAMSSVARP